MTWYRLSRLLVGLLVLGACAVAEVPPPYLRAGLTNDPPYRIAVESRGAAPITQAELLGPGDIVVVARDFHTTEHPAARELQPRVTFGAGGGSRSGIDSGISIGLPLILLDGDTGPIFVSRTELTIPDWAGYRADPGRWRLRVTLGREPGTVRILAAPVPR